MAIEMTQFEINRWNSDDQALATLADAHWDLFFCEPLYGKQGVESRKHKVWRKGLMTLAHAALHLRGHTAAWKKVA
jgi:hypothetical protein